MQILHLGSENALRNTFTKHLVAGVRVFQSIAQVRSPDVNRSNHSTEEDWNSFNELAGRVNVPFMTSHGFLLPLQCKDWPGCDE